MGGSITIVLDVLDVRRKNRERKKCVCVSV